MRSFNYLLYFITCRRCCLGQILVEPPTIYWQAEAHRLPHHSSYDYLVLKLSRRFYWMCVAISDNSLMLDVWQPLLLALLHVYSLSWSLLPAMTHGKSDCFEKGRLFCALICQTKMYWIWVVRKLEKGKKNRGWHCSLLIKIKQTFGTRLVYSCAASYYHLQVATINLLRMAVWGKQRLGNPNMINGLFFTPSASSK